MRERERERERQRIKERGVKYRDRQIGDERSREGMTEREQMDLDEKEDILAGQAVYEHSDEGDDSEDEEDEEEGEEVCACKS